MVLAPLPFPLFQPKIAIRCRDLQLIPLRAVHSLLTAPFSNGPDETSAHEANVVTL